MSTPTQVTREGRPREGQLLQWAFLLGVVTLAISAVAAPALVYVLSPRPAALREFGRVPEFSLTERGGSRLTREGLRGTVWSADFIFTRCAGICLKMSSRMSVLQERILALPAARRRDLRLVSFSVDAVHDTPERLDGYGKLYGADPDLWYFVTGAEGEVRRLAGKGFPRSAVEAGEGDIIHSSKFVLVDREGTTVVLRHGDELEVLATNVLDEPIDASPVAIGDVLYLRSKSSLYAIATP